MAEKDQEILQEEAALPTILDESVVLDSVVVDSMVEDSIVGEFVVEEYIVEEFAEKETAAKIAAAEEARTEEEETEEETVEEEAAKEKRPKKKSRFCLYCVTCCVLIVVLIIILVPVLVLVAFPKFAQLSLNISKLQFSTINITSPANSSFVMHTVGKVTGTGPIQASVHFPDPISVYWQANDSSLLLGNITMDDLSVQGGGALIDSNANFTIANVTTFTSFNKYLLSAPSFTWHLLGVAEVSALGRTAKGLQLDKTVTYSGINGFPGIKILNITLPVTNTPSEGIEIDLIVEMDNPSPLGIQLGDVDMRLEYEGTTLGPASISNFFLAPGVNNVPIKTILLTQSSSEDSDHVSDLLSKFIQNVPAYTLSYGLSAYPDGQNPIVWLTPAIQSLVLNVSFVAPDPATLNSTAKSFAQSSINGASLSFDTIDIANETATGFTTDLDVLLNHTGPLSASIRFPEPVKVFSGGILLGSVTMPPVNVAKGKGHLVGPNSGFSIADPAAFAKFTKTLLATDSFQWTLVGAVSATALNRTFTGLTLNKTITLDGMGGFKDVHIEKFNLPKDGPDGGISMEIASTIYNPSPIGVQLGVVSFQISYKDVVVGPVKSSPDFFLAPGNNTLELTGEMIKHTDPYSLKTISDMFSLYVAGDTVLTTVQGLSALPEGTDQVAWLDAGITSLKLSVPLNNAMGAKNEPY